MLKPARIIGFAAIVLTAFGTAAAIAAIGAANGETGTAVVVAEESSAACEISFVPLGEGSSDIRFSVNQNDSRDLDLSAENGFSVACGAGSGAAAVIDVIDAPVSKGDFAAF